jgi:phosphatidylserine/phosphatidylglycerophosphate/cardiolipin synthase-like enzyme
MNHPGGDGGSGSGTVDAPGQGSGTADAAMTPTGDIQIIVEPNGNKASELVTAINNAQHSVYMTMYEIDHQGIVDALVAKAKAGLDVQAVIDGSSTTKSFNMSAFTTLQTAGVGIVWSSPSFTYTHEKTVIIDDSVAWIMTMNANTSSPADNREYLAIDTSAADIAEATAVFKADHAMQKITPTGALVVANSNARPDLYALITSATTSLDVEVEELSDTDNNGIVDGIVAVAKKHIPVHVVVANAGPDATSDNMIKSAGGSVVMTGPTSDSGTGTNPYIHAKAILVDCSGTNCRTGFVGSENFSAGSLGYNRELGVIFDDQAQLAKVKTAIDTDFAAGVAQ